MGSLLVLLNTDNQAVAAALADPATPAAGALLDTLEVDLVTDLVGRAVGDEAFREAYMDSGEEGPEDDYSIGALVRALVRVRLTFANESVDEALVRLRELRSQDPSRYRAAVQHGLAYPRSARS
jgi:hypothetical protein